jgi:hypothetical protein
MPRPVQTSHATMRSPKPLRVGRNGPDLPPDPPASRPRPVPPLQEQLDWIQSAAASPLALARERRIQSEGPADLAEERTDEQTSDETEKNVTPPRAAPQRVSPGRPQHMPRVVPADEAKLSTPPGPDLAEMKRRLEAALSRPNMTSATLIRKNATPQRMKPKPTHLHHSRKDRRLRSR